MKPTWKSGSLVRLGSDGLRLSVVGYDSVGSVICELTVAMSRAIEFTSRLPYFMQSNLMPTRLQQIANKLQAVSSRKPRP
jgi:hypothetical protein